MSGFSIAGSALRRVPPLHRLEASSGTDLDVTRWADRPARLVRMDRLCALALVASDAALVDAGLSPADSSWNAERTGVVLGTAFGSHATNEAYYRGYLAARAKGASGGSPRLFAYTLPSSPVGEITIHHRILGPSSTTISGSCAAIDAMREAMRHLDAGRADRMLVVSADVATPLLARLGYENHHDTSSAVVLERGTIRLTSASRFAANDGAAAREAVLRALHHEDVDASQVVTPVAPLVALADFVRSSAAAILIMAVDPCGLASALRIER